MRKQTFGKINNVTDDDSKQVFFSQFNPSRFVYCIVLKPVYVKKYCMLNWLLKLSWIYKNVLKIEKIRKKIPISRALLIFEWAVTVELTLIENSDLSKTKMPGKTFKF